MAQITAQCELMTNALPASALDPVGQFSVVHDAAGEPMIFSIGTNGRLYLVMKSEASGTSERFDLSQKFKLPATHRVTALAVTQDQALTVHLLFAAGEPNQRSTIFFLRPTEPDKFSFGDTSDPKSLLIQGPETSFLVKDFLTGKTAPTRSGHSSYPSTFIIHQDLVRKTEDICMLRLQGSQPDSLIWSLDYTITMPCNPEFIVGRCVADLDGYSGLYVLYQETKDGPLQLRFVGVDLDIAYPTLMPFPQNVPNGASSLETFVNSAGLTNLVISSSEGLCQITADDGLIGTDGVLQILSTDDAYKTSDQLFVAQTNGMISFWSLTAESYLHYQEFDIGSSGELSPSTASTVPLLAKQAGGGHFYATQHPRLGQDLFVVDEHSKMRKLEQNIDTRLWTTLDVMIPDISSMDELTSYTALVKVRDKEGDPLSNYPLRLSASVPTEAVVNGRALRIHHIARSISTDEAGIVTIILRGHELSAPILTVCEVAGAEWKGPGYKINPMEKLLNTVSKVESGNSLKKELGDEENSDVSSEDWASAADGLKQLSKAAQDIQSSSKVASSTGDEISNADFPAIQASAAGQVVSWDFWTWLTSGIENALSWTVDQVKEGWAFVVQTAKGVWKFILKTVTHVAQAIKKVFEAIKVSIEKLIKWVGFLFNWQDIVETKNILVNLTIGGMLWAVDKVDVLDVKVEEFFEDMKERVRRLQSDGASGGPATVRIGRNAAKEQESKSGNDTFKREMENPGNSYGSYQMRHGGTSVPNAGRTPGQTATQRTMDSLGNVFDKLKALVETLGTNIAKLFEASDKSVGELLTELGLDLLLGILEVAESIIRALIKALADLILKITGDLNEAIEIPVLSCLYRKISDGADLSILDAVCLVLAIPTTAIYKMVKDEAPAKASGAARLAKPNIYKADLDSLRGYSGSDEQIQMFSMQQRIVLPDLEVIQTARKREASIGNSGLGQHQPPPFKQPKLAQMNLTNSLTHRNAASPIFSASVQQQAQQLPQPTSTSQRRKPRAGQTVFEDDLDEISGLKKILPPIIAFGWFHLWTVPQWFVPESEEPTSLKAEVKASLKVCGKIAVYALLAWIQKPRETDVHRNQPGFVLRMSIWCIDAFNVFGPIFGKTGAAVLRVGSCAVQAVLLFFAQKVVWDEYGMYDVAVMFDEWIALVGKTLTGVTTIMKGAYPMNVITIVVVDAGYIVRFVRMVNLVTTTAMEGTPGRSIESIGIGA